MNNLLNKTHILQFIILLLFYILSNNIFNNSESILYKNSEYYLFLKNIVLYNKITEKYIKFIKHNKDLPINNNELLLSNNDYFYLFYNKYNIYIYFFKEKKSNVHNIYFNGINNRKDLLVLLNTVIKLITNQFNFEHVTNLINKNGNLYKVLPNSISKIIFLENNILKKNSLMNSFEYIYNKEYINNHKNNNNNDNNNNEHNNDNNNDNDNDNDFDNNNKINLNINGFSLGGVLSQVFVHNLLDKYKDKLNIQLFNIESWFGGNENEFNKFNKKISVHNIYNKNSVFYFYNKIFQPYFNNNQQIEENNDEIYLLDKNKMNPFPNEIIRYINNYHFLSKIIK